MNVAVFCSSSIHIAEVYRAEARKLGKLMAAKGHTLVYGGTPCGLMGDVAKAVTENGGKCLGIIPQNWEHTDLVNEVNTHTIFVADLAARKTMMSHEAEVFVALPGGIGTFDEAFSIMAMHQIGETPKSVILVNTNGFYDGLKQQLQRCEEENCLTEDSFTAFKFVNSVDEIFE